MDHKNHGKGFHHNEEVDKPNILGTWSNVIGEI